MPRQVTSQGTRWCFTLNNYTNDDIEHVKNIVHRYIIFGKEVGESGTPHLQGFIIFPSTKRLAAVRRLIPRGHWSLAGGTNEQASVYCKKDDLEAYEHGDMPLTPAAQRLNQIERWRDVIRAAEQGTAKEEYPREFVQYNSTITRLYIPSLSTLESYSGLWYVGPPGSGKSRAARADFPGLYNKLINKWWDGYNEEETVLVDDLSTDHLFMGSFLKNWCDHYPFRAEHKGGSRLIRPKTIVITSNYLISDIWTDRILVTALERRFTYRYFQ